MLFKKTGIFGYIFQLKQTHSFNYVPIALLSVVDGESVPMSQHQLLQVQSEWPGVLRVQSPDTVQSRIPNGWRGERPIKGLEEPSARPLDGSGCHSHLLMSLRLLSIHLGLLILHPVLHRLPQFRLTISLS